MTHQFQHHGIEVSLHVPSPRPSLFISKLRPLVQHAYDLYINGDPRHGVQEIGQIIENVLKNVGLQAKKKNALTKGGFPPAKGKNYPFANLVEDLMREYVLDNAILGRCRGFAEDRNNSSHPPTSIKQAVKTYQTLKNAMSSGLRILEELPIEVKKKGYLLKIS